MSRRDGADEDEPTMRARLSRSRTMRELLAENAGIELEPDAEPAKPSRAAAPAGAMPPPNRGDIRRVLIAGGVAEKDLRWMTMSCISVELALERYPPLPQRDDSINQDQDGDEEKR